MSKVYDIWFQRYRYLKIKVCGKDSTPLYLALCAAFIKEFFDRRKSVVLNLYSKKTVYMLLHISNTINIPFQVRQNLTVP